jgi:hypothetical protein
MSLLLCWAPLTTLYADVPATKPAPATLFAGRIEFTPPADWEVIKSPQTSDMIALYLAADHDGYFAIQVLPADAMTTAAAAAKIVSQLHANHKKAGQEIVEEAKVEKDPRFAIKIHERYKTKDGKVADETHLYRQVGGRAIELDVQSLSEDQGHIDEVRKAGEETLASALWKKPVTKK